MAFSEKIIKHKSVFEVQPVTHNPPGINDFEIIKPISKGAYGQVYLARRKGSQKLYALKAMKKSDVCNKNMMEQVVVERDALAISSKSSYVVQLYYSFQNDKNIFLVMDYMIGGDLKSLLHNVGFFDEKMSKFYIAEVALALEYLHGHSIYHSDIKPDNMLLSATGHVKLTDFGLSTLSSENKPTVLDLVKHNTPYEQKEPTRRSNIFWRTPGQLQSLVCKFTFSSPKPNKRKKGRFGKLNNSLYRRSMDFEFSTPERRSYNTTPCAFQKRINHSSNSGIYGNESSKLLFSNTEKNDMNEMSNKRNLANLNLQNEKENLPKRFRSSLPLELDTRDGMRENNLKNIPRRSIVTFNPNVDDLDISITGSSDQESFVDEMSVDTTVSTNNNTDMSGVTPVSETSLMTISSIGEHSAAESLNIKDNVKWCQSSPQLVPNEEPRFFTPVKSLRFNSELEDNTLSYCSNTSEDYTHLENTTNKSCSVFDMPFKNQTPFRTPKSCVRGKVAITEKRNIQGTPDYLAPEILLRHEFGAPADWWALGVCFYEFVTGVPPFNDDSPELVFEHILEHEMIWPEGEECLSESTVDTIKWLLSYDPAERPIASDIKQLQCFSHLKWDVLKYESAPFIPQPDDKYDTTYFDAKNLARKIKMSDFII